MNKKNYRAVKWLLPLAHKYRIAGIIIFLASVAGAIVLNLKTGSRAVFDLVDSQKGNVTLCSFVAMGLLAGLFLIAATKEKKEDEQYMDMRMKALGIVFIVVLINIFSKLLLSALVNVAVMQYNGPDTMISLLVIYLLTFHIMRWVFLWRERAKEEVPEQEVI